MKMADGDQFLNVVPMQGRVQGGGARSPLDIQEIFKKILQLKNTAATVGRLVTAWERRRMELAYQ